MLTSKEIEAAKPQSKEFLLADGHGLYLRVRPEGKVWLFVYTDQGGARRKSSLGRLEDVPLAMARSLASGKRQLIAASKDPRLAKVEQRAWREFHGPWRGRFQAPSAAYAAPCRVAGAQQDRTAPARFSRLSSSVGSAT